VQGDVNKAYENWVTDPSPENMGAILKAKKPLILSEISRYPGDNRILKGRAKKLAVDAVRSYDPASGARLTSWIVTQLQPLSRYGRKSSQLLNTSELAYRQFAEIDSYRREFLDNEGREPSDDELADMSGISVKRINQVRKMNPVVRSTGAMEDTAGTETDFSMPAVQDLENDPLLNTAVEAVYDSSDERDKAILDMKMGRNKKPAISNQEIAMRLGVSPGLVSQRSLELAKSIQDVYGI
jgi:DNA-directed RNA polymerase specialized sigma subunit